MTDIGLPNRIESLSFGGSGVTIYRFVNGKDRDMLSESTSGDGNISDNASGLDIEIENDGDDARLSGSGFRSPLSYYNSYTFHINELGGGSFGEQKAWLGQGRRPDLGNFTGISLHNQEMILDGVESTHTVDLGDFSWSGSSNRYGRFSCLCDGDRTIMQFYYPISNGDWVQKTETIDDIPSHDGHGGSTGTYVYMEGGEDEKPVRLRVFNMSLGLGDVL